MHVYINMCVHIYNSSIFPFYNGPPNKNFGLHLDFKVNYSFLKLCAN